MRPRISAIAVAAIVAAVGGALDADRSRPWAEPDRGPRRVAPSASASAAEASPIDVLDDRVHERFRSIDGFGIARLPVTPQHFPHFAPETDGEKAAVAALGERGWDVAMYLGGRALMTFGREGNGGPLERVEPISQPILVSGAITPADLPGLSAMTEIGRRALLASASSDRYEASVGRWTVDARMIRASRDSCVKCHVAMGATGLKLGDALGVAAYVYARPDGR